jgi:uncharacterized protein
LVRATLPPLIESLRDPARYPHAAADVELIETHISWVLLAGDFAYKIKKPVNLGFLDFSTLEKRHHFCEEELRLNRRLAPQIYLDVTPISGTPEQPEFGRGPPIEFAVKMVRFPQSARLDRVAGRGELQPEHMDRLAAELADFHRRVAVAASGTDYGAPDRVYAPMTENFAQIRARVPVAFHAQLGHLEACCADSYARLAPLLNERRRDGFVRECHGDAHLANIALIDGEIVLFDCIEFNDNLRWIDVLNEVAFSVMDLDDRDRAALGRRLLNRYLEITGDYTGMRLFRFYKAYRAMVRAKVAAIRLDQAGTDDERTQTLALYRSYADLAERYAHSDRPALIITHGPSGSGKTAVSGKLIETGDFIRLRSDVERKRLHGLDALARSGSGVGSGIYTSAAGNRTYEHLAALAETLLDAGFGVIVDAAFLRRAQRDRFRAVAAAAGAPFLIVSTYAPVDILRARVAKRARTGRDASEAGTAVLENQLATMEPLGADELEQALVVDTNNPPSLKSLTDELWQRTDRRPASQNRGD